MQVRRSAPRCTAPYAPCPSSFISGLYSCFPGAGHGVWLPGSSFVCSPWLTDSRDFAALPPRRRVPVTSPGADAGACRGTKSAAIPGPAAVPTWCRVHVPYARKGDHRRGPFFFSSLFGWRSHGRTALCTATRHLSVPATLGASYGVVSTTCLLPPCCVRCSRAGCQCSCAHSGCDTL